ncbi:hypothetical protein BKA66DRAFT_477341 [Pyrenochaeta sp. MPI-SDFR-AT-0127]|nr:hypothetical protein BKA66DRAFT_477341 [Pyrenochaeta sp. MPI-SDFR-AT-0127]
MRFQTQSLRFQSPGLRIVSWPESPQIDIVFVHGPRGKHKTDWIKDGTFWPKDLLANDLGDARIACWEYKRKVIACFEAMGGTTMEFADEMCNALFHVGGYGLRPLIFIAHDLGGLLVQRSLANARIGGYPIRESVRNIHAVVFFGLPGTIQKQVQLLEDFMRESCVLPDRTLGGLERLNSDFWGAVAESNIKLAYCNPTRQCSRACRSGLGKLDSSFLKNEGQLNQPNSARIEVEVISIPTCHCAMTKFSSRGDPGYSKILDLLQKWSNGPVPEQVSL